MEGRCNGRLTRYSAIDTQVAPLSGYACPERSRRATLNRPASTALLTLPSPTMGRGFYKPIFIPIVHASVPPAHQGMKRGRVGPRPAWALFSFPPLCKGRIGGVEEIVYVAGFATIAANSTSPCPSLQRRGIGKLFSYQLSTSEGQPANVAATTALRRVGGIV